MSTRGKANRAAEAAKILLGRECAQSEQNLSAQRPGEDFSILSVTLGSESRRSLRISVFRRARFVGASARFLAPRRGKL